MSCFLRFFWRCVTVFIHVYSAFFRYYSHFYPLYIMLVILYSILITCYSNSLDRLAAGTEESLAM